MCECLDYVTGEMLLCVACADMWREREAERERDQKRIAELAAAMVKVAQTCRDRAREEVRLGMPAGQLAYEHAAGLIEGIIAKEESDG